MKYLILVLMVLLGGCGQQESKVENYSMHFWNEASRMMTENPNLKCSFGNSWVKCCDPT